MRPAGRKRIPRFGFREHPDLPTPRAEKRKPIPRVETPLRACADHVELQPLAAPRAPPFHHQQLPTYLS